MNIVLFEWRPYTSLFQRNNLGLQYIASSLAEAGNEVHIFVDGERDLQKLYDKIISYKPDMVAITLFPETKEMVYGIFDKIKEEHPSIITVTGGHTATLYAAKILNEQKNIDYITYGESELSYIELCDKLEKGESIEDCKSIFYRKKGYIVKTPPREQVDDLDKLPFPAIDITKQLNDSRASTVFTSVSTSRGCLGNCAFCVSHRVSKAVQYRQWRGRTPKSIIKELEFLRDNFPDKRLIVEFVDSSFEDPKPKEKFRMKEFVDLLEASDLKLAFSFLTRAESWSEEDDDLIKRLKNLGLFSVSPGFESGSDATLRIYGKRASVEDNCRAYELFTKHNIDVCGMIIMFQPFTTFDDLRCNAEFLMKVGMAYSPQNWLHALYVFPDTRIFQTIVQAGLLLNDNKSEYTYSYTFANGKIEKLYQLVEKIKTLECVQRFDDSCEKILYELRIYQSWRLHYEEFKNVEEEMAEYRKAFKDTEKYVGDKLYSLFMEMVDAAEADRLEEIEERMLREWEELLAPKQQYLEQEWVRCRVRLLRKGLQLL